MNRWKTRLLAGVLVALLCACLAPSAMALSAYDRPGQKLVALTFDDGPGPYTDQILDALKAHNAKATFFMIGYKAPDWQETVRRVVAEGHQVGNHTYDHPHLAMSTNAEIEREVNDGAAILSQYTGLGTRFYLRPPYASYNSHVVNVGAVPVIWCSYDSEDWETLDANRLVRDVSANVTDGGIIIMHDTVKTTAEGMDRLLTALENKGYTMVTVEDLFWRRGIVPRSGQLYYSAPAGNQGVNRCEKALWYDESALASHWAYPAIQWTVDRGYMSYNEYGEFTPEFPLTRGMFVTVLGRLAGVSSGAADSGFKDVPSNHYASPYAAWARENGIMIGVGSGYFGVDLSLTRQEMAVALARYIQYLSPGADLSKPLSLPFGDRSAIASWAREGVSLCSQLGFLKGDDLGNFAPEGITTRAMGAAIIQRLALPGF